MFSSLKILLFAVGFSGQNNTGIGFVLEPKLLDSKRSFTKRASDKLLRYVPIVLDSSVSFEADTFSETSPVGQRFTVVRSSVVYLGTFKNALTISANPAVDRKSVV